MSEKLWGGRFDEPTDKMVESYLATLPIEHRLAIFDIQGSLIHSAMLAKQNIITESEKDEIHKGLNQILKEFQNNEFKFNISDEDIHMAIEKRLTQIIGKTAGKLHTARSRNDQTTLDTRLYIKDSIKCVLRLLQQLNQSLIDLAAKNLDAIMPGFTHLQTAQPILFSHWIMAYFQMFKRDAKRFKNSLELIDECPLGSAALAGTTFNIDRHFCAKELGFLKPSENSIDSVSDRDYMVEFCFNASLTFAHLSRLCEELIIFNSNDYKFVELSDDFCTGSSIMPQKKNPDVCEKMRGKTGRIYGNLMNILTMLKALPLAYNTDMSEDKVAVFDTVDTLNSSLELIKKLLQKMQINEKNMLNACNKGYSNATDLADYLAKKGLAFRQAHEVVGKLVNYGIKNNKNLQDFSIEEFQKECNLIENDIYQAIDLQTCVDARTSYGGTSKNAVLTQIQNAKNWLGDFFE